MPGRRLLHLVVAALALAGTAFSAGCTRNDDEVVSDVSSFCAQAVRNATMILAPPMGTETELQASIEFYRLMGQLAPVSIAEEWDVLVAAMETASTVVPGDEASEQLAAMTAYATEPSAFRVKEWLLAYCGLDLPITTIAPQTATAARTLDQVTP